MNIAKHYQEPVFSLLAV